MSEEWNLHSHDCSAACMLYCCTSVSLSTLTLLDVEIRVVQHLIFHGLVRGNKTKAQAMLENNVGSSTKL